MSDARPEPKCVILTDSTADLPSSWYEENDVLVVPMPYSLGGIEYYDDCWQSVSYEDFYNRLKAGEHAATAQTPIMDIRAGIDAALERGLPVVYLGFSSGLSGTAERQVQVVEALHEEQSAVEVCLLDTLLASAAQGYLVIKAVELRDEGKTATEIHDWAREALYCVNSYFTLDGLEHLRKGGRIPDVAAITGAKLDIKPILKITPEGELGFDKVARGRKKSIKALIDRYKDRCSEFDNLDGERKRELVIIVDADAAEDADRLEEMVLKEKPDVEIMRTKIGPVIGSHAGPGMVALAFWGQDRRSKAKIEEAARKGHAKIDKAAEKAERMVEKAERKALKDAEKKNEKIARELGTVIKGDAR